MGEGIVAGIVAGAIVSAGIWGLALLLHLLRQRLGLGHLYAIVSRVDLIQIVVPRIDISPLLNQAGSPVLDEFSNPANVYLMHMGDGEAIAQLAQAIGNMSKKCEIRLVNSADALDDRSPVFCIGGPNVNEVTEQILNQRLPSLTVESSPPAVRYGTIEMRPDLDHQTGDVSEDYGMVFVTRTMSGARCVLLFGVYDFGTEMAANHFLSKKTARSNQVPRKAKEDTVLIAHGKVDGLRCRQVKVVTSLTGAEELF